VYLRVYHGGYNRGVPKGVPWWVWLREARRGPQDSMKQVLKEARRGPQDPMKQRLKEARRGSQDPMNRLKEARRGSQDPREEGYHHGTGYLPTMCIPYPPGYI